MMLLTESIPNNISRTTYLLLGNFDRPISKEIVREDYLHFITASERNLILKAEDSFENLEDFGKDLLIEFFQTNNFLDIPKGSDFKEQILTIAVNKLCVEPLQFIKIMKSGIPDICLSFWQNLSVACLNNVLAQQGPNKVIKVLNVAKDDLTASETSVLYY